MTVSVDERVPFRRLLASCYLLQGRLTALRELLERFPESFAASGFAGMHLSVHPDNERGVAFYRSLGWEPVNEPDGEWAGRMRVRIDGP